MIKYEFEHFKIKFFDEWRSGKNYFEFETSGSTGERKKIVLTRKQLMLSANYSMEFLDPQNSFKTTLLCIRPDFIGGFMVLVRAVVRELELTAINPSSEIISAIGVHKFDLVSMVPLQLEEILKNDARLHQFNTIIVGGGIVSKKLEAHVKSSDHKRVFQSYGMTETASHVALRRVGFESYYTTLGDTEIKLDEQGRLAIKGSVTNLQWIQTNDLAELTSPNTFRWLGRADNVINSGGIKIVPEELEELLRDKIQAPYFIAGLEDEHLGSRVVLLIESSTPLQKADIDLNGLPKYSKPKEVICIPKFNYTPTGKIQRQQTLKLLK